MRDLIDTLLQAVSAGRASAYCRLVETRGSTPQKAGAAMIVFADGQQAGTLGGGCVEADVKRRALACLNRNRAEIATFQLDDDYGWDDGLICGGRMRVLIAPVTRQATNYFETLRRLIDQGQGFTEAVVLDANKSGLAEATVLLFDARGQFAASLGDADFPAHSPPGFLVDSLEPIGSRPRAKTTGGVALLPTPKRCRLLIVGAGHIGRAVAQLASQVDFEVWVVDDRQEMVSRERFPTAERRIAGPIGEVLQQIDVTPDTYCLIVTRGHNHDEEALYHLAERDARYVGMIGSRRKIKLIFDDLIQEGVSPEALARVYAPLGIHIGSQSVMEIAISILAELIAHRNLDGHVPGRPKPVQVAEAR